MATQYFSHVYWLQIMLGNTQNITAAKQFVVANIQTQHNAVDTRNDVIIAFIVEPIRPIFKYTGLSTEFYLSVLCMRKISE